MLTDVMSSSHLTGYATVGLVIFVVVFVGVVLYAILTPRHQIDAMANLPLADDTIVPAPSPSTTTTPVDADATKIEESRP